MISPFDDRLEMLLLRPDEPRHVTLEQKSKSPFKLHNIAHERAALAGMKLVDVPQAPKESAHHLVDEAPWAIDLRDPRCEPLAKSEMPSFEGQEVAELQNPRHAPGLDDALARERCASRVHVDVESEIETDFRRSRDPCLDDDQMLSARRLIARSHERRMMSLPGWMMRQ